MENTIDSKNNNEKVSSSKNLSKNEEIFSTLKNPKLELEYVSLNKYPNVWNVCATLLLFTGVVKFALGATKSPML